VVSIVFGAGGPGDEAGGLRPPLASPAPMPRRRPSPGTGTRLRQVWSFSVYKACHSLSLWIDRQLSFFVLSLLLSTISASPTEDLRIHATCTACMQICARKYVRSAGHIQLNSINTVDGDTGLSPGIIDWHYMTAW